MTVSVSVVVPTFNRNELLKCCLTHLFAQEYEPSSFEIIVVDDAQSRETRHLVESEGAKRRFPVLRYIPATTSHGPAAARNYGWRAASGKIIAFTDDDCLPSPGWLKAGVAAFTDGVAGVSGKLFIPIPPVPTDYEYNASLLQYADFVTANCFYLRDALTSVHGFDERFTAAWREDSDLFFRLLKEKRKMVCAPEAVVIHPVRSAPWGIGLKEHRKIMFNALLYKKHPLLYRRYIQRCPPWHYYCIVCTSILLPFSVFYDLRYMRIGLICIWVYMTGSFLLKRIWRTSRSLTHIAEMVITSIAIPYFAVFWRVYGAIKFRVFFL
ncbi:MAG: glycosyltransferase [wastewater metagenome]|nr:glycosyltransferase [Candidatus Loosdrechtia aerotolerans]